jgi:hypothetical protein
MGTEENEKLSARGMLSRGSSWFTEAKRTLVDKASELGEVEELWKSLEREADEMDSALRQECPEVHHAWQSQIEGTVDYLYSMDPAEPSTYWDKPVIEAAVFTGTATSGSPVLSTSYPLIRRDEWAALQGDFTRFSERRNDQQRVSALLSRLSPELEDYFRQAWQSWYSGTRDRRKPAMYEMRDTVQHCVVHLSRPGGRFNAEDPAESRRARVAWIADHLVSDAPAAQLIAAHAVSYPQLYSGLSRAHKVHFDEHAAFALLLQSQSFLLEVLSNLDWGLVKKHGLCYGKS